MPFGCTKVPPCYFCWSSLDLLLKLRSFLFLEFYSPKQQTVLRLQIKAARGLLSLKGRLVSKASQPREAHNSTGSIVPSRLPAGFGTDPVNLLTSERGEGNISSHLALC